MAEPVTDRVARLSLLALTVVLWRHAAQIGWQGLLVREPAAVVLVILIFLLSIPIVLGATSRGDLRRLAPVCTAAFVLVVVAYAYRDYHHKIDSETLPTSDGHLFMDVAARMLTQGKNPYAHSMLEAFRVYRMPLSMSTPLTDGDVSDRVAYPAFSFLVLVPAVLLGIPTYFVYALCLVGALGLLLWRSPWWARGLVFALFTYDDAFLMFGFGGIADTVWALCLVGAVIAWHKRPGLAAVLVGLACAQKQHAWFLVPFLLVRLWRETGAPPWRGPTLKFALRAVATFAVINLPFVLWRPHSWLYGVLEPLLAPMITLSEGLSALSMAGYVPMSKLALSRLFWLAYGFALVAYARHLGRLRDACWVLPGLVLWFSHRALMSYWYFYALTVVAAILEWQESEPPLARPDDAKPRLTIAGAVVTAAIFAAVVGWFATRPKPFDVALRAPFDTWDMHTFRLRVHVTNKLRHVARIRFTVQGSAQQPLQWTIDAGPHFLAPGGSGDYMIRAPRWFHEFDLRKGARLGVSDDGDPGVRTYTEIPADRGAWRADTIPNGRFLYFDIRNRLPTGWAFEKRDPGVSVEVASDVDARGRAAIVFAPTTSGPQPSALAACALEQKLGDTQTTSRFGSLSVVAALPETEIAIDVRVPPDANRPPWDRLYGLVLGVPGWQGVVLFDASEASGVLPSGQRFVSLPAARDTWTNVRFLPRNVLADLKAPLPVGRYIIGRVRGLDVPLTPLELGVFATVPPSTAARVEIGALTQPAPLPAPDHMVRRGFDDPIGAAVWRSAFDLENGNFEKAESRLASVVEREPTVEHFVMLGDARLLIGRPHDAVATYRRAIAIAPAPEAHKGLGWALYGLGDLDGAIAAFETAQRAFATDRPPRIRYLDSLRGLAMTYAKKKSCAEAERYATELRNEEPALAVTLVCP